MKQEMEEKLKSLHIASMSGNKEAYVAFLELSSVISKKYLSFLGGKYENEQNLDDLRQEILISIHQKKHTFQPERAILPWIYAIVRYRFIDFYRAKKRAPTMVELTDEGRLENEPSLDMDEIMSMLSPKQKELLIMVKVDGASYIEAASALNMSVPSVKVGLHRIIKSLRGNSKK
jgi:RNA polymerase sigma-70 factor, ECF subfamily